MNAKTGLASAVLSLTIIGCRGSHSASDNQSPSQLKPTLSKLVTKDIKVGTGPAAEVGDAVVMEYTGTLADGTPFDSNVPQDPKNPDKPPFAFQLVPSHPNVIAGWNKGIVGMKVGGERKLEIPWIMAYGADGKPPEIPPKSDLYFDVKLLGMVRHGHESDYTFSDVKKGSGPVVKSGDWVTIAYKATLLNNMLVDDSGSNALQFQAGTGEVGGSSVVEIKGVVFGVIGMQAGGERILTLPPSLAFNPMARNTKLQPNSMVRFDVKLLRVLDKQGPAMTAPKS